jgi:hypothetical protein
LIKKEKMRSGKIGHWKKWRKYGDEIAFLECGLPHWKVKQNPGKGRRLKRK